MRTKSNFSLAMQGRAPWRKREMLQILIHLWGDYLTQSDWMAQNKTKAHIPALVHALVYSAPFLLIGTWSAVAVIFATHFFIDRYRLARYVVWAKNWLAPKRNIVVAYPAALAPELGVGIDMKNEVRRYEPWWMCSRTGYSPSSPDWLAFWLLIIADNTLHLTINYIALRWL